MSLSLDTARWEGIVWAAAQQHHHRGALLRMLASFGLIGLFFVSIVDSSFIPLPLPGITDIMLVIIAAQHQGWILAVIVATTGSALGGYFSYQIGQKGGIAFIEKRVPPRVFNRIRTWMESHAILSVALPAVLPPPMPLSPFVLAAGALKMSRKKFLITFTISRAIRHIIAAWLGIVYGRHVLHLWNMISDKYATPVLIALWTAIIISCAFAFWKLYQTSHKVSSAASLPGSSNTPA